MSLQDPNVKKYGAGQQLFREGEKGGHLYFIKTGKVELTVQDKKTGEEVVVGVVGAQSVLGTVTFLESEPRSATAKCLEETECVVVSEVQRKKLLAAVPKWFRILVKDLAKNLRNANERYSEIKKKYDVLEKRCEVLKRRLDQEVEEAKEKEKEKPAQASPSSAPAEKDVSVEEVAAEPDATNKGEAAS